MAAVVSRANGAYRPQRDEDTVQEPAPAQRPACSAAHETKRASFRWWTTDTPPYENMTARDRLWQALDDPASSQPAHYFSVVIVSLILLSCIVFVVETIPSLCCGRYDFYWSRIEVMCVGVFTVEYLLRFGSVPLRSNNEGWFSLPVERNKGLYAEILARVRFSLQLLSLVDFFAIFPTWLQLFLDLDVNSTSDAQSGVHGGASTQFLRVVRLARIFRMFKLSTYSEGMWMMSATMVRSWKALCTLGFFMLIAVMVFSSIMYFVERGEFYYCEEESVSRRLCGVEQLWPSNAQPVGLPLTECGALSARLYGGDGNEGCCSEEGWYVQVDFDRDGCVDRSQFDSIIAAGWWCLVTMTTLGQP
mmetsp:Transcript_63076/g.144536  ORF Transcript_63076/g.144536 Transcript_63076/m.144536 type:complete len:361 (+) Transcript_63076:245-1327(+)